MSTNAPTADWVDPQELVRDPYPTYTRLRELAPVVRVPVLDRYLATSFAACWAIEEDEATYTANVSGKSALMNRALGARPMLRKDGAEHAVERAAITPCVRPKDVKKNWLALFEKNAATYLDALIDQGASADLNKDFAAPLAAHNLVDMLGFPDTDPADLTRWSHAFIAGMANLNDDPEIWQRCEAAAAAVDEILDELIPYYAANPDGSITATLIAGGLPEDVVRANVKLTISGGMNEPQHMVTNLVYALSHHPEQRAALLADPGEWRTAFDEAVRWLSPIGMYPRETTRDTVLEGIEIPAAANVGVVIGAANRDPAHFHEPDRFDITRERKPHMGFGAGVHVCAGQWAARSSVGQVAVPMLYDRLPGLTLDPNRAETWQGWVFRGLTSLPVTW